MPATGPSYTAANAGSLERTRASGDAIPALSFSVNREEVPDWIAHEFNVTKGKVALLEITSSSQPLYGNFIKYLASRAVDHDQPAPGLKDRLHSDPTLTQRQYPGFLTSRFIPEKPTIIVARRDLPKPKDEDKAQLLLGLGWGRVKTNPEAAAKTTVVNGDAERTCTTNFDNSQGREEDVFFHHFKQGEPKEEGRKLMPFRVLQFYAPSVATLEALCEDTKLWIKEYADELLKVSQDQFVLYTLRVCSGSARWDCQGSKNSRSPSSVILRAGAMERLLADAEKFLRPETRAFYFDHGIPYRRSYLFYGPPGQGKTSTIRVLAGKLNMKACFMQFTDPFFGDHTLNEALNTAPKPPLLVAEDIDALFMEDRKKKEPGNTLSFSGFLNAVDGLVSSEGLILIMTTNHPERLDPALLRCGRVDRRFEFPMPGREELANLFKSYYPDSSKELQSNFVDAVFNRSEKDARSIATLQQHFLFTQYDSAETCIERLDDFFKDFFPDGNYNSITGLYC